MCASLSGRELKLGVPSCSYRGICSVAGDRIPRVPGDRECHFSRLDGQERVYQEEPPE